jgi:hypothetical protein
MRGSRALIVAGMALFCVGAAPTTWKHPEGRALDDSAENVSLADNGWILLAPASRELIPGEDKVPSPPFLWSSALDPKGTLFAGGGSDALVLRVDRKGKPEPLFENPALGVRALAADVAGNVYVATFPTGRVYRVGSDGKTEVYFEPQERYLWAMTTDAFDRLYVATGERGIIYEVTGRGEGRVFFDSDEPHITSLAADPSGRLLAGSVGRGLLYRLDHQGRAEVILDSSLSEISSIVAASDGTVFAAAINAPPPPKPRKPGDLTDMMTIEITPSGGDGVLEEAAEERKKVVINLADLLPPGAEGAPPPPLSKVFRITPGRTPEVLWTSQVEQVYSLALDPRGHLLVGTGPFGRLYRIEPDGSATLLRRFPVSEITGLVAGPEGTTFVLTSNPGRVELLEGTASSTGRYLSPVRDAGGVASWGSLRWEADTPAGTKVEIVARSGNSAVPDETWSAWSAPLPDPRGTSLKLSPARFVQWRADLSKLKTEATPILKSVSLTWLQENIAPSVRRVAVSPPGTPRPKGTAAGEATKESPTSSLWLTWISSDANGDPIRHAISVRRSDETEWRVLAKGVKEPPFEIDASSLPEGRYLARVVADDEEANGPERGLTSEARSDLFDIDRSPPVINLSPIEEKSGATTLAWTVKDALSLVGRVEWAPEESGPWTPVPPRDGIADTPSEDYSIQFTTADARRRIFLRASDAAGNTATLEVSLSRQH